MTKWWWARLSLAWWAMAVLVCAVSTAHRADALPGGCSTRVSAGSTVYTPYGSTDCSGNHATVQTPIHSSTTMVAIRCSVDIAPGTGESVRMSFQVGACTTVLDDESLELSCLFEDDEIEAADTGSIAVTAGQCVNIKVTYSAGAAASVPHHNVISN